MLKINFHAPYTQARIDFKVLFMLKIDYHASYTQHKIDFKVFMLLCTLYTK